MRQFIYQEEEKGCGLACLRMALVEMSGQPNYKYLKLDTHPPYSLGTLQKAAVKEGASLTFYQAENANALKTLDKFPAILMFKDGDVNHLVYVPKAKNDKLLIYDPAVGKYWLSKKEAMEKWALIYGELNLKTKEKCLYKKPKIISLANYLMVTMFYLMSCICLFLGFYFMKDDGNYLLSIALLASYGIFEIVSRISLTSSMKKFDKKWLHVVNAVPKNIKERYQHYNSLKSALFPTFFTIMSAFVMSIFAVILFGLNNSLFFISVAAVLLYSLLRSMLFSDKITNSALSIERKEKILLRGLNTDESANSLLEKINKKSYKIASMIGNEQIISFIIVLMSALLPFIKAETITLNYYLLYFGGLYMIEENIRNIFKYVFNAPTKEREILYFYEYFAKDTF